MYCLVVWIALWIVSTHSKFQVNVSSNNTDITKCQFLHDNSNGKAIAIPRVFSENSRAKKGGYSAKMNLKSYGAWPTTLSYGPTYMYKVSQYKL